MYTSLFTFAPFFSFFIKWFWNSEFRIRRDKSFTNSSCYTMSQSPRKSFCNDRDIFKRVLLSFFSSLKYQDIDNFRIISDWKKDKELFSLFQTLREAFRVSKIRMDDDTFEMGRINFNLLYEHCKSYINDTKNMWKKRWVRIYITRPFVKDWGVEENGREQGRLEKIQITMFFFQTFIL